MQEQILEAAAEIPDHELLWFSDDRTQTAGGKQGILEQLGRMRLQDGYGFDSCVVIAGFAVCALKQKYTSREIENAIRRIRMTSNREWENPEDELLTQQAKQAVLDLRLLTIVPKYR